MPTYYLRADGDDARSGDSRGRAWRTLERANRTPLAPGDRLLLEAGATFAGTLTLSVVGGGDPRRPVVVGTDGRGRARIDAGRGPGVLVRNAAGVRVQDLTLVGAGRAGGNTVDGVRVEMDLPGDVRLAGIELLRLDVSGFGDRGVAVAAAPSDQSRSGFARVRLTQIDAHDNGDAGIAVWGAYRTDIPGWSHADVVVSRCRAWRNHGVADRGGHSGNGIVLSQVDGGRIERCTAYENGKNSNHGVIGPVGIWAWDSRRIVIERCLSHSNRSRTADGGGFDLDGGMVDSVLRHNVSHDNDGAGFMIFQFKDARPCRGNVICHNVSRDDGRKNLGGLFVGGGVDGARVFHNRVEQTPRAGGDGEAFAAGVDDRDNGRVIFRGNRLTSRRGAPLIWAPTVRGEVRWEGNVLDARDAFVALWRGVRYASRDAWRAQSR